MTTPLERPKTGTGVGLLLVVCRYRGAPSAFQPQQETAPALATAHVW